MHLSSWVSDPKGEASISQGVRLLDGSQDIKHLHKGPGVFPGGTYHELGRQQIGDYGSNETQRW